MKNKWLYQQKNASVNKFMLLYICCLPLQHLEPTSGFGYRWHPINRNYAFHSGIDLRARHDTVYAVMQGRLAFMGYDALTGVNLRLASGGFSFLYGHLSQVFVLPGDSIRACGPIGITGATGLVTGEHLHFGVSYHGLPINPLLFLYRLLNNVKQIK